MRFLRHLGAVLIVVGVVVGLGLLWGHASSAGGPGPGPGGNAPAMIHDGKRSPVPGGPGQAGLNVVRVQPGPGLSLGRVQDLIKYFVVQLAIIAVVVAINASYRRRRRAWKRGSGAGPAPASPAGRPSASS